MKNENVSLTKKYILHSGSRDEGNRDCGWSQVTKEFRIEKEDSLKVFNIYAVVGKGFYTSNPFYLKAGIRQTNGSPNENFIIYHFAEDIQNLPEDIGEILIPKNIESIINNSLKELGF